MLIRNSFLGNFPAPNWMTLIIGSRNGKTVSGHRLRVKCHVQLCSASKEGAKSHTVRHINKAVINFLKLECDNVNVPEKNFFSDLKTVAMGKEGASEEATKVDTSQARRPRIDTDGIHQLLKLIVLAVIKCPRANHYLARMPGLSLDAQQSLKSVIEEVCSSIPVVCLRLMRASWLHITVSLETLMPLLTRRPSLSWPSRQPSSTVNSFSSSASARFWPLIGCYKTTMKICKRRLTSRLIV